MQRYTVLGCASSERKEFGCVSFHCWYSLVIEGFILPNPWSTPFSHHTTAMKSLWPTTSRLILLSVCLAYYFPPTCPFSVGSSTIPLELSSSSSSKIHSMMLQNDTTLVEIQGYVIAKRDFGRRLCFFDIADHDTQQTPVQALWKLQDQDNDEESKHQRLVILPGAQIRMTGVATPSKNIGQSVLLVKSVQLVGIPNNPQHVRILLQGIVNEQLKMNEFCRAANISSESLLQSKLDLASSLQTLAKEIVANQTSWAKFDILFERQRRGFTLPEPDKELLEVPAIFEGGQNANVTVDELLEMKNTSEQKVTTIAWIQNRRKFGGGISTIVLTDTMENDDRRIKGVLHPTLLSSLDNLYHTAAPGSKVEASGIFVKESHKLWISSIQILRCSPRPSAVKHMVELLYQSKLPADLVAVALEISTHDAEAIRSLSITERQWKSEEIANTLQATNEESDDNDVVLHSYESLRVQYPVSQDTVDQMGDTISIENRSTPGSRWKRKKQPQLDWIGSRIVELLQNHPEFGKRKICILDIGGGQGYLANRMSSLFTSDLVDIQVLDIAERAVKNGAMRSKRLNHNAVQYCVGDASADEINLKADIVVGLHACGTLTDVALAHAIRNNAGFVICPCCYKSNEHLPIPGIQGDPHARPPSLRQEQFWGIDKQSCDHLRSLAELQLQPKNANKAAHTICCIRAEAAKRFIPDYCVQIKAFPVAYSTRNLCIIGTLDRRG